MEPNSRWTSSYTSRLVVLISQILKVHEQCLGPKPSCKLWQSQVKQFVVLKEGAIYTVVVAKVPTLLHSTASRIETKVVYRQAKKSASLIGTLTSWRSKRREAIAAFVFAVSRNKHQSTKS